MLGSNRAAARYFESSIDPIRPSIFRHRPESSRPPCSTRPIRPDPPARVDWVDCHHCFALESLAVESQPFFFLCVQPKSFYTDQPLSPQSWLENLSVENFQLCGNLSVDFEVDCCVRGAVRHANRQNLWVDSRTNTGPEITLFLE